MNQLRILPPSLHAMGALILMLWLLGAAQSSAAERLEVGTASIERLGRIYTDGAGPFITARGGDWRLSNEHLSVTFAGVEDMPTTWSMPVRGLTDGLLIRNRLPGSLIDVAVGEANIDVMGALTQGIGLGEKDLIVPYDFAEPVERPGEVGLRLEGSPFDNRLLRLETTWWLAEGSRRLCIESRFLDLEPGADQPQLADVAHWGLASPLVAGVGALPAGRSITTDTPFLLGHNGNIGMVLALDEGLLHGRFGSHPNMSRSLAAPTTGTLTSNDEGVIYRRSLWIAEGESYNAVEAMQRDLGVPTGTVHGRVQVAERPELVDEVVVRVIDYGAQESGTNGGHGRTYGFKRVDADGSYELKLPADRNFFIRAELRGTIDLAPLNMRVRVAEGEREERNFELGRITGVFVKVVDAATSRPLAARVRVQPIAAAISAINLGPPTRAEEFLDQTYVPAEGRLVRVIEGQWRFQANHGIRYETGVGSIDIDRGQIKELVIALDQVNPTPGWLGLELGVRTRATPGIALTDDEIVLMAAAEGLEWVVSGDFETITDLGPSVERLGLGDRLRVSRGFRTLLPAHPEWGTFLVFPLPEGAPDPAQARAQWAELQDASEFIATLRRLYPGALIHSDLPIHPQDLGYFTLPGENYHSAGFKGKPGIETAIDSIALVPTRRPWEFNANRAFWFLSLMKDQQDFVAAVSPMGSIVLGSEPGYPRVLVKVGQDDPAQVEEQAFFEAFRRGRTQITNGPFIELQIGEAIPGDMIAYEKDWPLRARITAPGWARTDHVRIEKDGVGFQQSIIAGVTGAVQRFPEPESGEWFQIPFSEMALMDFKDTLISVSTYGSDGLDKTRVLDGTYPEGLMPFAMISPILIDTNGNGHIDTLENFGDRGR